MNVRCGTACDQPHSAHRATFSASHALRALSEHFKQSAEMPLPMGTHRLAHSPRDPDGSTFWSAAYTLRAKAWERVVREAKSVVP